MMEIILFLPRPRYLSKLTEYLDSLTLFEESAFIHILVFIILLLTIFNILLVFFGNEIIKYFDIENRFPSLSFYIKVRAKFQRYYLLWNIFTMFVICIIAIGLNLFMPRPRYLRFALIVMMTAVIKIAVNKNLFCS